MSHFFFIHKIGCINLSTSVPRLKYDVHRIIGATLRIFQDDSLGPESSVFNTETVSSISYSRLFLIHQRERERERDLRQISFITI